MKKALFILIDNFSDWECGYLSSMLNESKEWEVYTASTKKSIKSVGGFTVKIDKILGSDFTNDLIVLVGSDDWDLQEKRIKFFIEKNFHKGAKIAAICGGVDFLAYNGFLNDYNHTGNSQKLWHDYKNYKPKKNFIKNNVVSDRNLVTANGTSPIDFTLSVLKMINFDNDYRIEKKLNLYKLGYYKFIDFYSKRDL